MFLRDFLSPEAGQKRREWLDDTLGNIIPPELRGWVNAGAELNPVTNMERAGTAAKGIVQPGASGWDRAAAAGDMATNMAAVLAPVAGAKLAGTAGADGANAIVEALTAASPMRGAVQEFGVDEFGGVGPRDPRLWHPASDIKLRMPVDEMRFGVAETNALAPVNMLRIDDLQGRTLVPAFGDRTRAGGTLASVNDAVLAAPVDLQGGADFMRSPGGIWASEPDAMKTKAKHIGKIADEIGEDPVLAYTAMGAQAGDFSKMMSEAVMGQIRPSMSNMIDPPAVARYDETIRKTVDKDWPGILSQNAATYIDGMTGSNRRLLWQEMDKGVYRDAGFPDVGATRLAITDPRLVNANPFDTGLTFGRVDASSPLTDTSPDIHATYRSQIHGDYLGGLPESIPGEKVWRGFFDERRAAGASPASDQRAFMMKPSIRQKVDQQMVDEVNLYLQALEQLKRQ
jgi:hypothetical protein